MKPEIYQIARFRQDRFGIRYFRYLEGREYVLQIVINPGSGQKGRSHAVGVYQISRTTFLTNYLAMGYLEQSNQATFDQALKNVFKQITDE